MLSVPRVAVGTVQAAADVQPMLWALMGALRQQGVQVQSFLSQACFARYLGEATLTGRNPRHLDSWLMPPELCRELFERGTEGCDLAMVEGEFGSATADPGVAGGRLDTLCDWLDLPRIIVLDVSQIEDCRLPARPERIDGLLLDRVTDVCQLARLATNLEAIWGVPVLGSLEALPQLRAEIGALPGGTRPPQELCRQLGNRFLLHSNLEHVVELACRRDLPLAAHRRSFSQRRFSPLVVALAYDEVLNCYFPDTLDLLESLGATIVDFSPLRDERLPEGVDIVYLGCGHPEQYAAGLSHNHCMKLALRDHLRTGGRMYAEGGGLAYLCQQLETADGALWRMAGIFPAVARLCRPQRPPTPVEVTLEHGTWLNRAGASLRGYYNPRWRLEPAGPLVGCIAEAGHRYDVVRSCGAVGSQLHLHFAAVAHLLPSFFETHLPQPDPADPWSLVP